MTKKTNLSVCLARPKLGHRHSRLVPLWLQVFQITARKTHQQGKITATNLSAREGGCMRGAYLSRAVCRYSIDSMWLRCVCWTLQHSTAVPGKAILFLTCTQVSFSKEWFSVVRACVSHASWHTPVLMVCMPYVARGRLQGHRATRSLGVHCGERKQA